MMSHRGARVGVSSDHERGDAIGYIGGESNTFTCPQSFGGEVHQDSEAFAGALWEGRQLWGNQMVRVVIGTIALLPDDASMEQASAAMIKVARWRLGELTLDWESVAPR